MIALAMDALKETLVAMPYAKSMRHGKSRTNCGVKRSERDLNSNTTTAVTALSR